MLAWIQQQALKFMHFFSIAIFSIVILLEQHK